ncbi:MAG: O-antigen ligase family protein [Chloroflexota bacterium]
MSIFWSLDTENTIQRIKTYSQVFLLMLIYWDIFQKPETLMAGLQAYVYGSYILVMSAIYNYVKGNVAVDYEGRYSATGINANELTLILTIGLPIAMQLFFTASPGKKVTMLKFVNLAYVPLAMYSIVLTGSRTLLIAIIPFGLFMAGTQQIRFDRKVLTIAFFLTSLLVLFPSMPSSVIDRLGTFGKSVGTGDLGGRLNLWRAGIAVLAQHPILGVGSGAIISSIGSAVHNTLISIAAETGFVGLILFVAILGSVIYQVLGLPKGTSGMWLAIFTIWIIGILTLSWEFRKLTWIVLSFVIIESGFCEPAVAAQANDTSSGIARPSRSVTFKPHPMDNMPHKTTS